nr:hypothetical protein GCM10020092_073110 [Actinoplanes digitatis]
MFRYTLPDESKKLAPVLAVMNLCPVARYASQVGHSAPTWSRSVGRLSLGEQVRAVAHALRTDVGAETDQLRTVRREPLLPLPFEEVALQRARTVVQQVDELVGSGHELDEDALLQRHHVTRTAAGGHPLLQLGRVVAELPDVLFLDLDTGMAGLVLLVEVLVTELAEGLDHQRGPARLLRAVRATARGRRHQQRTHSDGERRPPSS